MTVFEETSRLFAVKIVSTRAVDGEVALACARKKTYLRALTFLLLRLRRRTRFFLHFALIFDN